ncbi:hypothetical protein ACF1BQ_036745 [Bradyrhizobium sp. RDT10]
MGALPLKQSSTIFTYRSGEKIFRLLFETTYQHFRILAAAIRGRDLWRQRPQSWPGIWVRKLRKEKLQ